MGKDGESDVRRRLASPPFRRLASDLGLDTEADPYLHRRLEQAPNPDILEEILSMDNIEYYLGFSCFMQLVWIGLGYYLYKRCTQKRIQRARGSFELILPPHITPEKK